MPRILVIITRCRLQTADRIQNVDKVRSVDCRLQSGYKVQTENLKSFFVWYVIKSSCNLPSVTQSLFRDQLSRLFDSYENEDPENDDLRPPLRKRRPVTKTKTPYKNETHYKTKTPLRKRRPMTTWYIFDVSRPNKHTNDGIWIRPWPNTNDSTRLLSPNIENIHQIIHS